MSTRNVELLAEAFLLGVGAVGTTLFALGVVGVPLRLPTFLALVLVIVTVLAIYRPRFALSPDGSRYPWLASVLLVIPFAGVACDALVIPLADWDGLITWVPKARAIATDGSLYGPFFAGMGGLNLHNHYPLLLPLDGAIVMRLSGSANDASVRWLYALIPLALLIMLRGRLAGLFGAQPAAWIAAVVSWIPTLSTGNGSAVSAYSDLTVAAFTGAALLALLTQPAERVARECAPWLAFLAITKNEGVMLCLAMLTTAAVMRCLRTLRQWLIATMPMAIALLSLLVWRSIVPDAYDERYAVLMRDLPRRLNQFPVACRTLLHSMLGIERWGLLWPAAIVALLLALRSPGPPRRVASVTALFLALALSGYAIAFTVTSWNVAELARVTADRLLLHLLVPLACLLAAGWEVLAARMTGRTLQLENVSQAAPSS